MQTQKLAICHWGGPGRTESYAGIGDPISGRKHSTKDQMKHVLAEFFGNCAAVQPINRLGMVD